MGRLGMAMPCDSCSRSAAYSDRTASARSDFTGSIMCPFVRERSPSKKVSPGPILHRAPKRNCFQMRDACGCDEVSVTCLLVLACPCLRGPNPSAVSS